MWFVGQLLVYAFVYAAWRAWRKNAPTASAPSPPGHLGLAGYALALGLVSFGVRIFLPIDRWIEIPFFRFEPAHLPQYVSLFCFGLMAARGDWLERFDAPIGRVWLWLGIAAAAVRSSGALGWIHLPLADGGLSFAALVWALLESVICTGLCAGLLA